MKKLFCLIVLITGMLIFPAGGCRAQSNLAAPLQIDQPLIKQAFQKGPAAAGLISIKYFTSHSISVYREEVAGVMAAAGFSSYYIEESIKYALNESPTGLFALVFAGNDLAGASVSCSRFEDWDEAVLLGFGVLPQYRRLGIGEGLWRHTVGLLAQSGYDTLFLELDKNENNQVIDRWIRNMEGNGELKIEASGIAYDFYPEMIFYSLHIKHLALPGNALSSSVLLGDAI